MATKNDHEWVWSIPESRMRMRPADPTTDSTAEFDCGDQWYEIEINVAVARGKWGNDPAVAALEFGLEGETVGFAFVINKNYPYPDWGSKTTALTRLIFMVGINRRFRKRIDPYPGSEETLAEVIFRVIENLPREVMKNGEPVGEVICMLLNVYEDNEHAQRFYNKIGFRRDAVRPIERTGPNKMPTITLRKDLPRKGCQQLPFILT